MSALDMMRREIAETYVTRKQRAAYRAGLSAAAAICDEQADAVRKANPGRKGSASAVGEFGAHVATECGDAISAARAEIEVPPTVADDLVKL